MLDAPCYSAAGKGVLRRLQRNFRIPEIGTKMTLLSASEDFQGRTLSAFESVLDMLVYLRELRGETGLYSHWGMRRTYGEAGANTAIASVHSQVWIEMLRTPINELASDLKKMDEDRRNKVIRELKDVKRLCIPAELTGGSVRHFSSIVLALECLSRSMDATHRAA